jgi:ethanolamine ammonia-lyase small subunit
MRDLTRIGEVSNARLSLGRDTGGLPTADLQRFRLDHAAARQAVWTPLDVGALRAALPALPVEVVASAAENREAYLRRPDLGRRLAAGTRIAPAPAEIAIVVGDGLSSLAVSRQVPALLAELLPRLATHSIAPLTVATNARVALGDEIGAALEVRCVIMLIGERPGLSSPESLGAYLTFAPEVGLPDSRRNCISNIHERGLGAVDAAERIVGLVDAMLAQETSGVGLVTGPQSAALPR